MRVAIVSFFYDESVTATDDLLQQQYTITGWAEALAKRGIEVIVINRFHKNDSFRKNGVHYFFYRDHFGGRFKSWQIPFSFLKKIKQANADVVHLHHLTLSIQTAVLRSLLPGRTGIIIQHHGGKSPGKIRRFIHNCINQVADGFFFTTKEQGQEWFMKKKTFKKIMPVMEGATFFDYAGRDSTRSLLYHNRCREREITQLQGSPVFLWVGRLDDNKDPLTIIEGFKEIAERYNAAKLYMIYSDDRLEKKVQEKIGNSSIPGTNIHLLGKIPHEAMEQYYNSADYFVLGSHYEGSGYALSEALSCGCVPVITDIPSFKMMTDGGRLGALWQPGNQHSFAGAVNSAISKPLPDEANACIDFFKTRLSFEAIAATAEFHYKKIVATRQNKSSV